MDRFQQKTMLGFYENELTNRILSFWLPRCLDRQYGGYFNCYNNEGTRRVSTDKYTWSQGRFVWMYSKLALLRSDLFPDAQRERFLRLAQSGVVFLRSHCLMGSDDWRCVFLMDRTGAPKQVGDWPDLDMSIYADCFVIAGLACYSRAAEDAEAYVFARKLYQSAKNRFETGCFKTLPYPLSKGLRAHGVPMIFTNVAVELYRAAERFEPALCEQLREDMRGTARQVLEEFTDENFVVHEVIYEDGSFEPTLLGQHANPGHTLEDMWFIAEAAEILQQDELAEKAASIALKALEIGWDEDCGGLLHYAAPQGGRPCASAGTWDAEPTVRQVLDGWSDKLWWVHSEALYTTLLFYLRTGQEAFWNWHKKVFDYTFSHFPNPNPQVGEWIQILCRDGTPQNKVVALPVKDPYHITRNLALLIELLERQSAHEKV